MQKMTLIIPTFNRSAKLERTLSCYSLGNYNIQKMVVIDGSGDVHSSLNAENCRRLGFAYLHYDSNLDLVERLHCYLRDTCEDNLVCIGTEEDVFCSSYIDHAEKFLTENSGYSSYIGRYITLGKPLLGINRLIHARDFITNIDLSYSEPVRRLLALYQILLVGCSPVFFSARRRTQLIRSLEAQMEMQLESTQELVDQTHLALSGKIKFVKEPMLLRDETNIGYKFYETRHNLDTYITRPDIELLKNRLLEDFQIVNLELALTLLTDLWRPIDDKVSNSQGIVLTRHKKYYSAYENFDEQSTWSGKIIKNIAKIGIVISEIFSWPIVRKQLNVRVGKKVIKNFSRSIPTHAIYK